MSEKTLAMDFEHVFYLIVLFFLVVFLIVLCIVDPCSHMLNPHDYCSKCGEQLNFYCPECGALVGKDDHYCGDCSFKLK